MNIDHVVLGGNGWLAIDAKGCGAGALKVLNGRGVLVSAEGAITPQPWMDDAKAYSRAGALYRITNGKPGILVWVVPDTTTHTHPSVMKARFLARGGAILTPTDIYNGDLDQIFPCPAASAHPADVVRISQRLSTTSM